VVWRLGCWVRKRWTTVDWECCCWVGEFDDSCREVDCWVVRPLCCWSGEALLGGREWDCWVRES
jgi:hypothetical protein